MTLTRKDIAEFRRLHEAATPGDWHYDDGVTDGEGTAEAERGKPAWITAKGNVLVAEPSGCEPQEPCVPSLAQMGANGRFIAHAHNATPRLLDACEQMLTALEQVWFWFDDHDDRMTSAELHALLKRVLESVS